MQIDEACAGDLGTLEQIRRCQGTDNGLGNLARIALERLGHLQRHVRSVVAMLRLPRPVQCYHSRRAGSNLLHGLRQEDGELGLEVRRG